MSPDPKPPKRKKKRRRCIPEWLKKEVLLRDQYQCKNPGCERDGFNIIDLHHIVFKSQGGRDTRQNLIVLCRSCHDRIHHRGTLKCSGEYPDVVFIDI